MFSWFDAGYVPHVLLACAVAAVAACAVTPLVRRFAHLIGAIDVPQDERRIHKKPTPRLGGLAIFIGFIISTLLFARIDRPALGVLIGAVIIVALGCIDDVLRVHYGIKLVFQFAAALTVALNGLTIEVFSNPFPFGEKLIALGWMSIPATVIWIIALTNAVNLIDGLDGLACGVSMIGSVSLLVIAMALQKPEVAVVMAALSGGCLGFLPYNKHPARLFMGDTGATFLGFILATTAIQGTFKVYATISFAVPFLILGIPIFDTASSVFRRLRRGGNPAHADRGHIHHKLIDMGFSQKQAVALLYGISAALGITAVVLTTAGELNAILVLLVMAGACLGGYLALHYRIKEGRRANGGSTPPHDQSADGAAEIPAAVSAVTPDKVAAPGESIQNPSAAGGRDGEY
ncbi:MAG: undecaprenyl/decaprenyl-phosphate alpha-N-acetylglucosaminyl 1-phosphate transferase [Oscillospiraceae bacterium]|jgi:UDP-GlcNAc:undecaprenyl-phosphate GlcNAc-1-phosphate transferase|nr:undecaprenyl/decaprenyl-phosphate alpha-N-acetylglucosaminyl 1-phosphate transferase [Oscillospiraceae bacterium]